MVEPVPSLEKVLKEKSLVKITLEEFHRQRKELLRNLLPSFIEGFPVTILGALACETPVVTIPVGDIPEIIRNLETGILAEPSNPIHLAEPIQYLLENANVRSKMAHEGRKHVMEQYSLETKSKNYTQSMNN